MFEIIKNLLGDHIPLRVKPADLLGYVSDLKTNFNILDMNVGAVDKLKQLVSNCCHQNGDGSFRKFGYDNDRFLVDWWIAASDLHRSVPPSIVITRNAKDFLRLIPEGAEIYSPVCWRLHDTSLDTKLVVRK